MGGDPAHIIAEGLFWSRECVHNWKSEDTEKYQMMDTDAFSYEHEEEVYCPFDSIDIALSHSKSCDEKIEYLARLSETKKKNRFAI